MRKLILLTLLGGLFSAKSNATISLVDRYTHQPITSGSSIQLWGDNTQTLISWYGLDVVNNTGTTTKINLKRYNISVQPNVEDYFCWYVCLGSVVSNNYPQLNHTTGACYNSTQGDTLSIFSSYYKPMGLTGTSTYRYVWFDTNNPSDTAYFDITYNITPLSIQEMNKQVELNLFPNPAKDFINLHLQNVDFNSTIAIEIYDLIGNKVMSQTLISSSSRMDISDLSNGAYFCSIISDRKTILTKRVVISH